MKTVSRFVGLVATIVVALATPDISAGENDGIPPEILKKMDPAILSGKRPKFKYIRRKDIIGLRKKPKLEADFVRFSFSVGKLSKPENDILVRWIKGGHNKILLPTNQGIGGGDYWSLFDGAKTKTRRFFARTELMRHAVNTDCSKVRFVAYRSITAVPGKGAIVVVRQQLAGGGTGAICGMFRYGKTQVYFRPGFRPTGPDARRWELNWWHWALGKPLPGAANVTVPTAKFDAVVLKNGRKFTGTIQNEKIKIKLESGVTVEISKERLKEIRFGSSGGSKRK